VYDLSYNLVGFLFLTILTGYFLYRPIFPNLSNRFYRLILIISILSVGLNTLTAYTINYSTQYPVQLNYFLNVMFFFFNWTLPYVFYQYSIILTKKKSYFTGKFHKLLIVYYIIQSLIVITTPLTHWVIYFDSNLVYHHGTWYPFLAFANFLVLGLSGIIVILFGQKMPKIQKIIVPVYTFMIIGFNLIQMLFPLLFIDGLILSLATFLMFLTLQNPTSYYDTLTTNYSRNTFLEYLEILTIQNKPFQIIIVDVASTTTINKTFGEKIGSAIIIKTGQKVKWASNHNLTFRIDGDIFIVVTFTLAERDRVLSNLETEFPFKQKYNDEYSYNADVHLNYTNSLQNFIDIDEAYQVIIESIKISKERNLTLINTGTVNSIKKNRKIEAALKRSIEKRDVKIYLQPIINTKSKKVTKAEALVRIFDNELGMLMPDEFIPMAEKDGNITKLAPLIIEGVCKYLSETNLPDSFKNISINLSVIDCLNPNLDKLILNILKKYDIDPSFLIFEVTETVASLAPQLKDTMINIKAAGSTFALDDFGSGYANLDAVIKLPFDIIKIDRQLLLLMHNEQYKTMFSGIMDTLHSLNLETVVEGIETEGQAGIVRDVKGTYQQGYLYSKPLSMEDFTKFINSSK
jgi:EAL domain-containing protein (putative c-di-GMP-specific phosphodiesterase class I)